MLTSSFTPCKEQQLLGSKPKSGLAVMIAIGEVKKPVKKAVGGAVPKKSDNLANIVDQWDETDD